MWETMVDEMRFWIGLFGLSSLSCALWHLCFLLDGLTSSRGKSQASKPNRELRLIKSQNLKAQSGDLKRGVG